jgi:signal transduction histidine kinase
VAPVVNTVKTLEALTVFADAYRAVQTLVNLFGNAIMFSPAGSVVTVTVTCNKHDALFSVYDTGPRYPSRPAGGHP